LNPGEKANHDLFYERSIGSFEALMLEAASLDADAGLRVIGRYNGLSCYAFVTRFGDHYTVMIYRRNPGRPGRVGARLAAEELEGINELRSILRRVVPGRVRAFAY
jgi:hypothetical protein